MLREKFYSAFDVYFMLCFWSLTDGKFDQPFHVGVKIVASEKGQRPQLLLDGKTHNRSRNLHCDQSVSFLLALEQFRFVSPNRGQM